MGILPPHPIPTIIRENPYTKGIIVGDRNRDSALLEIYTNIIYPRIIPMKVIVVATIMPLK